MKTATGAQKMLAIRIDYEVGRRLKAVCAMRGKTVREVVEGFAAIYVEHAEELPPPTAGMAARLHALAHAVHGNELREAIRSEVDRQRQAKAAKAAKKGA